MTDEDLMTTYEKATHYAILYGAGFVKVSIINGSLNVSVVDPKDYRYLEIIDIDMNDNQPEALRLANARTAIAKAEGKA
jgi:hypothetical protein